MEDDEELARARREAREQRRWIRTQARLMFSTDPDLDAAEADPAREAPARAVLSRLGHAVGRLVGRADYEDRLRTEKRGGTFNGENSLRSVVAHEPLPYDQLT